MPKIYLIALFLFLSLMTSSAFAEEPKPRAKQLTVGTSTTPQKDPRTGLYIRRRTVKQLPRPQSEALRPLPRNTGLGTLVVGTSMLTSGGISLVAYLATRNESNQDDEGMRAVLFTSLGFITTGTLLSVLGGTFLSISNVSQETLDSGGFVGFPYLRPTRLQLEPWTDSKSGGLMLRGHF